MGKKSNYLTMILAVVFLLVGFGIGNWCGRTGTERTLQIKLNQAQKEIDWWKSQLEMFYPPLPEEIYSVIGKITKIEGNSILMESQIKVSRLPLPEGKEIEKKNIKVNLTDETKIAKIEMIVPTTLPPKEIFKETPLKFEDLKVGDQINVTSKENIKSKTEILADRIQLTY